MPFRLLHIITGLETGGAERSLSNLLEGGLARSFDCQVVSLGGLGHYGPRLMEAGVAVEALGVREGGSAPGALRRLRSLVRRFRPDVIHGWMYHGNLAALTASLFAPASTVLAWNIRQSLYDLRAEKRGTRLVIAGLRRCSRRPGAIVYNSCLSREQHEAFGFAAKRGIVLPNGFDTNQWEPNRTHRAAFRSTLGLGEADHLVGFVGRYHPMKDIPTFLRACRMVMLRNARMHVALVGEALTLDNPAISADLAALPQDRLHVLGRRNDVETLMPGFDFFCLSSVSEAFPNALGEAMACGLPCIATDVGECAQLLGGRGRIVPPGDANQLANAIAEMLAIDASQLQEMGNAARAQIIENYGLQTTVTAYVELYHSLLKTD